MTLQSRRSKVGAILDDITRFIQSNLPVEPVPTVPEIRVHRANPKSGLWRLAQADEAFDAPYWAHLWGGGLALARHVLDHPETVANRRVLDLGCGNGVVGIAAAIAGARSVLCADIDRYALIATQLNAALNGVTLTTLHADLTTGPAPPDTDLILVGDLFYDPDLAACVTAFLDRCLTQGVEILVGDPNRASLPLARLRRIADYLGLDFGDRSDRRLNTVFAFMRSV